MMRHMQEERDRLMGMVSELSASNEKLVAEVKELKAQAFHQSEERAAYEGSDNSRAQKAESLAQKLQVTIGSCRFSILDAINFIACRTSWIYYAMSTITRPLRLIRFKLSCGLPRRS